MFSLDFNAYWFGKFLDLPTDFEFEYDIEFLDYRASIWASYTCENLSKLILLFL